MESNPPNINYFENKIFNSILFDNPNINNDNVITIDYLNNNYLQKHENIECKDNTNATSSTGSITTLGGISVKKDLYVGCNLLSNSSTKNIFTSSNNVNIGSNTSTLNTNNIVCSDITNSGNLIT